MKQITKLLKEIITTVIEIDTSESPYQGDEENRNNALAQLWHAFILVDDEATPNGVFYAAIDALEEAEQFINCISYYDSSEEDDTDPQDNLSSQIREAVYLLKEKAAE